MKILWSAIWLIGVGKTQFGKTQFKEQISTYIALSISSSMVGTPRLNMIPRFILAGSSAQFERPIKPTRRCSDGFPAEESSSVAVPSSNKGCRVFKGINGESSASPISSNTTTDTNFLRSLSFCSLEHCLNVETMPSGVDKGLHWYDCMWIYLENTQLSEAYFSIVHDEWMQLR